MSGIQTGDEIMKLPIMMYHEIPEDLSSSLKTDAMHPSYYIALDSFKSHLQLISELKIQTLKLDDLPGPEDKGPKIILSFDDGYIGNYLHAFPAIKSHEMTATFFCAVSLIGKRDMMTWSQLREMTAANMSIQSHGFSHRPLASLNRREIYDDLKKSKYELEDKLGVKVPFLSLPHGSASKYVIDTAKEIGYDRICTSSIGYNKGDEFCLRRILASSQHDLHKFEEIITGKTDFTLANYSRGVKQVIKNIVGHKNCLSIYHFINKLRNKI